MSTYPSDFMLGLDPEPVWALATLYPPQGSWTVDDYLDLTDDTNRLIEYAQGRIEVLAMPTASHQRILIELFLALRGFVAAHELGEVLFAALRVRTGPKNFREPDIIYMSKANRERAQDRYWDGADLVVEIVSPDAESRERDLVRKRVEYSQARIPEYWIVDPQEKRITVLALEGDAYAVHGEFVPGQQAASRLLDGFTVDVAATFRAAEA